MFIKASPIFAKGLSEEMNVFATFRTVVGSLKGSEIHLTAFSFYQLRVNGRFVAFGPARTARGYAREDVISLDAFDGEKNEIVISVAGYHCKALSTAIRPSFLMAEVRVGDRVLAATGKDFSCYLPPFYVRKTERYSRQRHFTEVSDFRLGTDLCQAEYQTEIEVLDQKTVILNRTAPYPVYDDVMLDKAESVGTFVFNETKPYHEHFYSGLQQIPAIWGSFPEEEVIYHPYVWLQRQDWNLQARDAKFPLVLHENEYAIFDFSRIETGFFQLVATAEQEADIAIGFSEEIDGDKFCYTDMHCHNALEYFLPANKKVEVQTFEPYVARFAVVAVKSGSVKLQSFGLKTFVGDVRSVKLKSFGDATLDAVARGAVRTYSHNAVDLYTDCPSRERAGWLCDTYFTSKTEYALFGKVPVEDAFLENYRLFVNDDGYPEGMIPMAYPSDRLYIKDWEYIPQWAMWYIIELDGYLNERHPEVDRELFRPSIEGLLKFFEQYENEDGLLERLPARNFVEWSVANEWTLDVNYPTNFLYAGVLDAVTHIFGDPKYANKAARVRKTTEKQSYNGRLFLDHAVRDENGKLNRLNDCSEAGQYYAILFGNVDVRRPEYAELYRLITEVFGAERREPVPEVAEINAFIGAYLRLEALLKMGESALVLRDVKEFFGQMEQETGTLWEYRQHHGSRDHGFASYALVAIEKAMEMQKKA